MNIRNIKIVFLKEVLEVIRDWRTMFVMLVLPVILYPLLVVVISQLTVQQTRQLLEEKFRVVLEGEHTADLRKKLRAHSDVKLVPDPGSDPESLLEKGEIQVYLRGHDFNRIQEEKAGARMEIRYNPSRDRSTMASRRIQKLLESYREDVQRELFSKKGLPEVYREPFTVQSESVVTGRQRGQALTAKFLPYLLIIMTLMGAIYPAVDMTAGEKERKTIETLLVSPGRRVEIVLGKFFTVFLISIVTAALNLASMGITFSRYLPLQQLSENLQFSLSPSVGLAILVVMIPLSALFSGLALAISSFAKTYREGMMYTTPLVILCVLPAMITALPGVELSYYYSFVPVINVSLVFKNFMVPPVKWGPVLVSFLVTLIYAAGGVVLSAYLFSREQILLPESESFSPGLFFDRFRNRLSRDVPGIPHMVFALCGTFLLMVFAGGVVHKHAGLMSELIVTQVVYVLTPALLFAALSRVDWKNTFFLSVPDRGSVLKGVVLGLLLVPISATINQFVGQLFPGFRESAARFQEVFQQGVTPGPGLFFAIAVMAPICEELVFRGYLLSGIRDRWSPFWSAVLVGLLFGAYHLMFLKLLSTALAGFLLALLVLDGRSLLPAILAHGTFNGSMFLLERFGEEVTGWLPFLSFLFQVQRISIVGVVLSLISGGLLVLMFRDGVR